MNDQTKMMLIITVPTFFFWFLYGFFHKFFSNHFYFWAALLIFLIIIMIFLQKRFISKSYKNDEIIKKISIRSDAFGWRAALVVILLIAACHIFNFPLAKTLGIEDIYFVYIIFFFMGLTALITSIYYTRHPEKL